MIKEQGAIVASVDLLGHPSDQYASLLKTSPPERVPSALQVGRATLLLMNRTEPSPISTLTPPGWRLEGGTCIGMLAIVAGKAQARAGLAVGRGDVVVGRAAHLPHHPAHPLATGEPVRRQRVQGLARGVGGVDARWGSGRSCRT